MPSSSSCEGPAGVCKWGRPRPPRNDSQLRPRPDRLTAWMLAPGTSGRTTMVLRGALREGGTVKSPRAGPCTLVGFRVPPSRDRDAVSGGLGLSGREGERRVGLQRVEVAPPAHDRTALRSARGSYLSRGVRPKRVQRTPLGATLRDKLLVPPRCEWTVDRCKINMNVFRLSLIIVSVCYSVNSPRMGTQWAQ